MTCGDCGRRIIGSPAAWGGLCSTCRTTWEVESDA